MSASFEARRALLDLASDKHRKRLALVVAVAYLLLLLSIAMLLATASLTRDAYEVRDQYTGMRLQADHHLKEAIKDLEDAEKILNDVKGRCGGTA